MNDSAIVWQRVEGLAVLLLGGLAYQQGGYSWILFGALFLAPDVSIAGYALGSRRGAAVYNVANNYALPAALGAVGHFNANGATVAVALIWAAHVGFDRFLGYGLKLPSGFKETHLGRIGKSSSRRVRRYAYAPLRTNRPDGTQGYQWTLHG